MQNIWNPGFGFAISWQSISPATGSTYPTDTNRYVGRTELDPLGSDVTNPPDPVLVTEPFFYNARFDSWPIEASYDWSDPIYGSFLEEGMTQYVATRDMILARDAWQDGDRDRAMQILSNNPNVGLIALFTGFGLERPVAGLAWGADAAEFLGVLGDLIDNGTAIPGGEGRRFAHAPQDTGKRWIGGDRLSDCYKKLLKPFFALDLSNVSIDHYIPPGPRLWSNPDGYTFGNDIYVKNYNPSTQQGLTDLLHELTHVQQFKELGLIGFPKEYLKEYKQNRDKGMSDQDAYFNIRLEAEARQHAEETYKRIIADNGGKNPCAQ